MTYKVITGGGGIWIFYETRIHPNTIHVTEIAEFLISNKNGGYNCILNQSEQIVNELNKLNKQINLLKSDLAICQTPALFNRIESKRIIELEKQLKEKNYETDHLTNSIYRITNEFNNEKENLIKENFQLKCENNRCSDTIEAVRKEELGKIPTSELAQELYSRMENLDKLERSHSKLLVKHKTAANMIADLKEKPGENIIK